MCVTACVYLHMSNYMWVTICWLLHVCNYMCGTAYVYNNMYVTRHIYILVTIIITL